MGKKIKGPIETFIYTGKGVVVHSALLAEEYQFSNMQINFAKFPTRRLHPLLRSFNLLFPNMLIKN